MKRYIFCFLIILGVNMSYGQHFQVTLEAPQYRSGIAYLTYRMGNNNLNVEDSAAMNNKGIALFKGSRRLPGGIYVIVLPGKRLRVDFFVDKEQIITVKVADTLDLEKKVTVLGSKENILYQEYQKYINGKGRQRDLEKNAYNLSVTKADSALHEKKFNALSKEMNDYRENLIKTQPHSMMAALLSAMKEPLIPIPNPRTHQDSLYNYNYYKAHYWDGITFMDERVIRTPIFLPKLERYYREVMVQNPPDSIIKDADYKLLLARSSPEMYKFLLNWLTDEYINPKYMGQDAIFVHLFEKYHSKGLSNWLNEKQMDAISRRAYMLMANLIGEKAANLEMIDSTGKPTSLYDVNAEYIVICFWDPTCGHCREEIPRLDSIYQASWKKHNVKIYAVLTQDEKVDLKTEWVNYIKDHKLGDWIHVYQTRDMEKADLAAQKPGYHQLYDVTLTPTLYLLDKEKRIIGKKLTWQQLNDLMLVKWKTN